MRNELLTDFEYISGCNEAIKNTLIQYSGHLRQLTLIQEPTNEQFTNAVFDISYSLLHDVVLMGVCSFIMKYEAKKRRKLYEKNGTRE